LKACGVRLISALPETWLVHLIRMADNDPEMILVRLAKEEEGVGISAGAHLVMLRLDALKAIYPRLEQCIVVTIMGAVAVELQSLGHRPGFFYLEHAMGVASSMGLGIALARPELRVVVLDGDGSILMNLGGFPTATSTGSDIAGMAAAAGIPRTAAVRTVEEFTATYVTDLTMLENRFQFQRHLREIRKQGP